MDSLHSVLVRYLPTEAVSVFVDWIREYHIHLHITRNRRSKAGDYRPPSPGKPYHRISVNHNLNPYAFLITFAHELAHRVVWEKYSDKVLPHGKEWNNEFRNFLKPFMEQNTFPPEIRRALISHTEKAYASSYSDHELTRVLRKYDSNKQSETLLLEELEPGQLFHLGDKRIFRKGKLLRKRFHCQCITNNQVYLVSANAPVYLYQ